MENPCEWCVNTSNLIDSLEYEVEDLTKQIENLNKKLQENQDDSTNNS